MFKSITPSRPVFPLQESGLSIFNYYLKRPKPAEPTLKLSSPQHILTPYKDCAPSQQTTPRKLLLYCNNHICIE